MLKELEEKNPLLKQMAEAREVFWLNPNLSNELSSEITDEEMIDAEARLERFAPYIQKVFPETLKMRGIIESPLQEISKMRDFLLAGEKLKSESRLFLKCDNALPISGSIKARGGIYEVLCFAEEVALKSGKLHLTDDYSILDNDNFRELFSHYSIAVGSTGNLGLSIGIMSARLGLKVTVHMSSDARQWKKDLLRSKGVKVIEYAGDYQLAVAEGRASAAQDPSCHFIDDENSKSLFLGYTTAASRLKKQLENQGVVVDESHPLFVYLPCGVGGGPGGVTYGLKKIYGENVHCFFAEPVQAPCMLLGVMTGLQDKISVQDIGLTGKTAADGLAIPRASKFVGKIVGNLLDGCYTVVDEKMERLVIDLFEKEKIFVEPSATAGFPGYTLTQKNKEYVSEFEQEAFESATHIVWATGGNMVPEAERQTYLRANV